LICLIQVFFPIHGFSGTEKPETKDTEVYTLGEVVVTGKKEGVESVGTVHKITQEEISISGARNLNEAIDLLPGVNVMTGGDAVPRIDIRGFRPRHNILLLNGIPINSTYDQQFNPSIIPVENIAEIKMTSGPSSVLYGQGGLGGVINIITKKGTEGIKGMAGAEAGTGKSHMEKVNLSGRDGKVNFFSSASYSRRDSYPLSRDFKDTSLEGGSSRDNSDKETGAFFTNLGFDPNDNLSMGLTINYLFGEYGIPVVAYDSATDIFAANKRFSRIENYNGCSVQAASEYFHPNSDFNIRGWIFFNQMDEENNRYGDNQYNSFTSDPSIVTYRLENGTKVSGFTLQPQYDFGEIGMLTVGLSAELDSWESRGTAWNRWSSDWPPGYVSDEVDDSKEVSIYSAKMEYEWMMFTDLGFTLGYANHYQKRHDHSDYEDVNNPGRILSLGQDTKNDYSILAGSYYDVTVHTRLKAAFQRNIRFPSIRQLYDVDSGNPALTTERVYHYSAGIEQKLPKDIRLTLDGFHSIARDFIEKDSRRSDRFENFDHYLFTGAELAAEINTFDNYTLRTCYSYLHTEDKTGSGRKELQYRPMHRVTVENKYTFPWGLIPYASFVYVGDQYYYSKGGNPWEPPLKAKLDEYLVVNLKLNYKFRDRYTVYAGADNIFDENYEQSYGYPLSGRTIYGGAEMRF
jgi:vitamin B12 transporter